MMSVQGPLARSVGDLRLALAAMAGPIHAILGTPRAARAACTATALVDRLLGPRRLAAVECGASPGAGWLAEAGCVVEEVALRDLEEAAELWRGLLMTEADRALRPAIEAHGDAAIRAAYSGWAANVTPLPPDAFASALARRTALARAWSLLLSDYAAALLPVSLEPPFPQDLDQEGAEAGARILAAQAPLYVVNLLGLPGLSVPTGLAHAGIPLGVQLASAQFREDIWLALGEILEARAGVTGPVDPVS